MRGVAEDGALIAMSANSLALLDFCPVKAMLFTWHLDAISSALITLGLLPLVEIAIRTSPGLANP